MRRIEQLLESAKEQTEDTHNARDVLEMAIDDFETGRFRDDDGDEDSRGERIRGKCPECGKRQLWTRDGGERVEIYCGGCDEELLEYEGSGTVTDVNFYDEVGGHSVSFAPTG